MEIVGLVASALIIFSMVFKTTSFKGTMAMRIINAVGSIFFVIYGFFLPAYATGIANSVLFFLNTFYIVKEYRDHKKLKGNINNESNC